MNDEWKKYTKPSDATLLTVCLGDIAMSNISEGDKAVVDAAIRVVKRETALREKLEKLAEEWAGRVEDGSDAATWSMAGSELSALVRAVQ